jgi:UDP-N-acetylglucosamine 1-carboxyvinyltransferase
MVAKASKLVGAKIYLDLPSNGATENIMMAAVLASGETIIENAACDPEIIDLANFLNSLGGNVRGAGTHTIVINGVTQSDLHSTVFRPVSDRLEAGTYLLSAISTGGEITLHNIVQEHLQAVTSKLEEAGVVINYTDSRTLYAKGDRKLFKGVDISTGWYPGFPTDLQPVFIPLLAISQGTSTIKENIYEDRFGNVPDLVRMGADIKVSNNVAVIKGVESLSGTKVEAQDIRGGAGLVVAGLTAVGTTEVTGLGYIDRGYENLVEKLTSIGASITRTKSISAQETSEENLHKEEKLNNKAKS